MKSPILFVILVLLMIDSLLEVAFIGSTVGYLHKDGIFNVVGPNNTTLQLLLKPLHLSINQGHTSNGAAGTALILVGLLGLLVLSYHPRIERSYPRFVIPIFLLWTVLTILSFLLTLAALIYTFVMVDITSGQSIDLSNPTLKSPIRYPFDDWAPQTWFSAVLQLQFVNEGDKSNVRTHLNLMNGWKWNLIVLFLLEFVTCALVVAKFMKVRKPRQVVYDKVSPNSPMGEAGGFMTP